jgi:hypothetical protein
MHNEPKIMRQIAKLLEPLDAPAQARVIGWTISALDVPVSRPVGSGELGNGNAAPPLGEAEPERFTSETEEWLIDEQDYTLSSSRAD